MGALLMSFLVVGILLIVGAKREPKSFVFNRKRKFKTEIHLDTWPDAVDDVASAIRAGMSLPQAICNLARNGPKELKEVFIQVEQTYLSSGNFLNALEHVRALRQPVAIKFVSAISVAYQVGGSELGTVLRALSDAVRDEVRLRGEIAAKQSWTINGARLAVAAPWVTVVLLSTRSSAAEVYFSSSGIKLLIACAALTGFAYFAMIRIGALPTQDLVSQ